MSEAFNSEVTIAEKENLAQTLARELKQPFQFEQGEESGFIKRYAVPPGWLVKEFDDEQYSPTPRRKTAKVTLHTADAFIDYVKRHGSLNYSTIWCGMITDRGFTLQAVINDNGETETEQNWPDHVARYTPSIAYEWELWNKYNGKICTQREFSEFIEENNKDIVQIAGSPSGKDMLEMALNFESCQEARFKTAIRLQNGGIQMTYVQDDNDATVQQMLAYSRFSIGIKVFDENGEGGNDKQPAHYRMDARLRYRAKDGARINFTVEFEK